MKEQRQETKKLIPSLYISKEQSLMCYIPIFYSFCITFFTTASIVLSLMSSSSLVSLSDLPLLKPSFFQLGILLSCVPGFIMIWAYHLLIWSKLRDNKNALVFIGLCFVFGIFTQISLVLFAIVPNEQDLVSENSINIQENIFLSVFMVCSIVYESFSLTLMLQARNKQILSHQESWITGKIGLLTVIFLVSFINLSLFLYLGLYKTKFIVKIVFKAVNYIAFFLHIMYSCSFYWDLKQITFAITFGNEEIENRAFNFSTF